MKELIDICDMPGVSGYEFEIAKHIEQEFTKHCEQTTTDLLGNVIGIIGKGNKKKLMIEAHLDEIGLMVNDIDDNGFISFTCMGGINPSVLPAAEVCIHGSEAVFGVIGAKPPHLQSKDEAKNLYKIKDLYVDTGFSKDTLVKKVQIGDVISFKGTGKPLLNGMLSHKSIDNRKGIACLLKCMQRLKTRTGKFEIAFLAAVQEEVG